MVKYIVLALVLVCLHPAMLVAQEAPNVRVTVSWEFGPEPDIQYYQLYVSSTCVDTEYGPAGDRIGPVQPLDPDRPDRISTTYEFNAPLNAETERCFKVTAIDTSDNESDPSSSIMFRVDKLPPAPPEGLSAEEVILGQ